MKNNSELIRNRINESILVKQKMLADDTVMSSILAASEAIKNAVLKNGKVLLAGNGGSSSDAEHIAGELVGRFQRERVSIPAFALSSDAAVVTAIANDYGYKNLFSRQLNGLLNSNDVFIGISTSGNSENIYEAVKTVKEKSGNSIALLGKGGGKISEVADISIIVPSNNTARIQESHIMIGHILCEIVENAICK